MDITAIIKQNFNIKIYNPACISSVYQVCDKIIAKFKCLTLGERSIVIYYSDNGKDWCLADSCGVHPNLIKHYLIDVIALSLILENTFVEILYDTLYQELNLCKNIPSVNLFLNISKVSDIFYIFQNQIYNPFTKLFIHAEVIEGDDLRYINDFFENTAYQIIWL